ncbi:DNA polymerase IV [Sphingorhabdus lutea]|uniref:DNA polymerase IV n=1 Tax=Sphingorhabdus lutea TaxID=1913578 RepID=A0A1L3JF99_9SPHN|nr:DNA polymerase IV [Sphingorhabdus lutea]APG63815.1 DNA polymerase IV [Sphingorhabdus lutea]
MGDIRKIIHVDMDAFFASVEQRDNPDLRGKPVAVGGSSARGVVAAASYEARKFGVKSAMPSVTAKRLCPDLIFTKGRFDAYRQVSGQIREIFRQHTDLIEPLSLDEAYLDVTHDKQNIGSAVKIAKQIRAEIEKQTQLTASAGVSYNKFIAKLASDQNKPNGICVILPEKGAEFVASLPVRRFHGVGPRTAEKMQRLGIKMGQDLLQYDEIWMAQHFGSYGQYLFLAARGIDNRPVQPSRKRKSVGAERTFGEDKSSAADLTAIMHEVGEDVWARMDKAKAIGKTVILKIKYNDFTQITRSLTPGAFIKEKRELFDIGEILLRQIFPVQKPVRLLGLTMSNLSTNDMGSEIEPKNAQPSFDF